MTNETETRRLRLPKSLIDRITALARSESRTWTNMARVLLEKATGEREERDPSWEAAHDGHNNVILSPRSDR